MRKSRSGSDFSQKLNNIMFFLAGVLAVVLIGVIVIGQKTKAENAGHVQEQPVNNVVQSTEAEEKWQEGTIQYNGRNYKYNNNVKTYLLMGVDKDGVVETARDGISGGQSDAIFLLVADTEKEEMNIISINRNTMTGIQVYDKDGNKVGKIRAQLCLQHGYGDGKKLSCNRSEDAVSELFDNIPISGYMAINMGAIPYITDAVGGVRVTVMDDLTDSGRGVNLVAGEEKVLNGDEAYVYIRKRETETFGSADERLRRQEQFITSFITALNTSSIERESQAVAIYNAVSDYLVTDVDFETLVATLLGYKYTEDNMYTVPGETVQGSEFEEFYPDEDALEDLIIQMFYKEVE